MLTAERLVGDDLQRFKEWAESRTDDVSVR